MKKCVTGLICVRQMLTERNEENEAISLEFKAAAN
jgi:hypothetical protein